MKKILLLGGSAQQVIAIKKARELGYYTILCDYLQDNPGQYYADKFYLISTTDMKAVYKIAKDEKIDGILSYASDPAAPTAAYIAEKLNLPGNPYVSVDILCNKDKFRKYLSSKGFNAPKSRAYIKKADVLKEKHEFEYPIIIKPVDSSGSKGVTVVHSLEGVDKAIDYAFSFTRSSKIIVESYIEKKHKYLIGGDIFVQNGKIVIWGLLNCHRDSQVNPLVPVGKSYPLELSNDDICKVKNVLQKLVDCLKIESGSMNVELIIDKNDKVWLIDIGPRAGGNMIPDLLSMIFNVDLVKLAILSAMGEHFKININESDALYATHNLHSRRNGIFVDIEFSSDIEKNIIKKQIYKKHGDEVRYFANAADALGIIFLRFSTKNEMNYKLEHINSFIHVILDEVKYS